jgi:hypothetical protein
MAYSFGRQFRRIAAEALTADRDEMGVLTARILPPREPGAAPVLHVKSEDDCKRAPAVIVAAFFADALTGDEAADLLRKIEDPAFRKQAPEDPPDHYAMYGPICLTPGWRDPQGRPYCDRPSKIEFPVWGPPRTSCDSDVIDTPRRSAANEAGELVNNNENTSAPCCDAADHAPERPP